ncbi:MAG TPA: phosphoadenosine phosphosulfate reductase family protein, partial [Dehalococcoidia bacterium]|nr:phosphoadenosine phosphosulfate reductase family protein [Dehalococcoidia bacterium]
MASETIDRKALATELEHAEPRDIIDRALEIFSPDLAVSFSGAEDVALVDIASKTARPFRVITLDTGRLHPETYQFIERVRDHYDIAIEAFFPQPGEVEALVHEKG